MTTVTEDHDAAGIAARDEARMITGQIHLCERIESSLREKLHYNQCKKAGLMARRGELLAKYDSIEPHVSYAEEHGLITEWLDHDALELEGMAKEQIEKRFGKPLE